jgi:hypothetical protein
MLTPTPPKSSFITIVKEIIVEVAKLERPVIAAAVAALAVVTLNPFGINLDATELAGILVGVGTVDAAAEKLTA